MLNVFMTLQDSIISNERRDWEEKGVKAIDLEKVISNYPELIMLDYRKRKTYISSILAKNEMDSKNPYNNALFIRVERGYYCLNPELAVLVEDKWVNVYEFTGLNVAKKLTEEEREDRLIESLKVSNEKMRKLNPGYSAQQDQILLDYKRRMEEMRQEKLRLANKTSETKPLSETEKANKERELLQAKEQWAREDERKKMLAEKHRKDIEDMMKKKPL